MTRTLRGVEEHRQADAVVDFGRQYTGLPAWVEQETHAFPFGCAVPDLSHISATDRTRYQSRLEELFIRAAPPSTDGLRIDAPDRVHLGLFHRQLDRSAAGGAPLDVHVGGRALGMAEADERTAARRLTELVTLCFAHPAVRSICWDGENDMGGLLRRDFSPTQAYRLLQKLIHMVWHTRAAGLVDAEGRFRFRGFYGDYRVGVQAPEETKIFRLSLRPGVAPTLAPIPAAP